MSIARSILFYLVFYGVTAAMVPVALVLAYATPGRLPAFVRLWARFHRGCLAVFIGIKVRETGQRFDGLALYAFTKVSFFEAIDLPLVLEQPGIFAKRELFSIPGWGRVARVYGMVPVARKDGVKALRAMLAGAKNLAANGRSLVIFPEGTRVAHGSSVRLQSGFAALYKALDLPVVPVAVDSGPCYHRLWKRPGTITLHFGEPIEPGLPRAEVEAQVFTGINALNQ